METKEMGAEGGATLLWLRRDLRLGDHPGWERALAGGGPVIPVFALDPLAERRYGAAAKWRLGRSLDDFGARLQARGSRLILRRGEALATLRALVAETGARRIVWSRQYDSASIARDTEIKAALSDDGIDVESVNGSLLFEPWTVNTKTGGFFRVYTPFWKAVSLLDPGAALSEPGDLAAPSEWPKSDALEDWHLGAAMNRGADVLAHYAVVGEEAARNRLDTFLGKKVARYGADRDRPDRDATSRLSENLTYGEISPRTIWWAATRAEEETGAAGPRKFLQEVVWREFGYHLLYHTPQIETENWRSEWDSFPWRGESPEVDRWRRGMTGIEMVDAGLREMYVTGTMHNRVRMLVASFLTKHLLSDWRLGEAWFRDCLIDWDPASNALGWQWVAGSGPDAAPYFRIFNPDLQAQKFDPKRAYRDRWLAEGRLKPSPEALSYFEAVPRSWGLKPDGPPPEPVIGLAEGRAQALAAYQARDTAA